MRFCFLDMDGVLADFLGGLIKLNGRELPYNDPMNLGVWETDKLWGMTLPEFWAPTLVDGFWQGLLKTPEADAIVQMFYTEFGEENVAILTAPSKDSRCVPEKREWVKNHYPGLEERMIFTSAKHFLAAPGRYLIDDRDMNVIDFRKAGGSAVTVPRLWNNFHRIADAPMEYLQECFK